MHFLWKIIPNLFKLIHHKKVVHGFFDDGIFVSICDLCNMRSKTLNAKKRHTTLYHDRNRLQCEKCNLEALSAKKMKTHRLTNEEIIIN